MQWKSTPLFNILPALTLVTEYICFSYTDTLSEMKSNEDNKTWISNILVRNIFLCLKQIYCGLTFVCVYMWDYIEL